MNDALDILEGGVGVGVEGDALVGTGQSGSTTLKRKSLGPKKEPVKRPEGMHRELFALLCFDGGKGMDMARAPLLPTDTPGGYKQKANLGAKQARRWKWTPFTNPARKDGALFYHWRRALDENRDYPFAKFNKEIPIQQYSEQEYANNFEKEGWTKEETDHLFDLARRFDLRFHIMHDRYEKKYPIRTIEDLKERYYHISGVLSKLHADPGQAQELKVYTYDADHEKKRKEQLNKLWARTPEQVEEEEYLRTELRKIEARKREREKKTQDLQKLITAADGGVPPNLDLIKKSLDAAKKSGSAKKKSGKSSTNPKLSSQGIGEGIFCGIKWSDFKNPGVTVRSSRMKLPGSVGQKKMKAIESMLLQHSVDHYQIPTEEVCVNFNDLRSDMVLHHELTSALQSCHVEIHTLKHQFETIKPGETLEIPKELEAIQLEKVEQKDEIGIVPSRKRKAALEQSNVLKKLKQKI